MKQLTVIAFLLFFTVGAFAQERIYRASYEHLDSANYTGSMWGVQGQYKTPERSYLLGARRLSRKYTGAEINENAFDLGAVFSGSSLSLRKDFYLETGLSLSPNSDILPQQTFVVTGHWLSGRADFGVGLGYSHYKTVDATTVRPFYLYELSEKWRFGSEAFLVFSDCASTAGHASATHFFNSSHSLRADVSGGDTLEDAGVHANYSSASLEYGYHRPNWSVFFFGGTYSSDLRREGSYGLRLEIR